MRTIMMMTVAAVALLALGCGNTEQLEAELAAANVRVAVFESALIDAQRDLHDAIAHADDLQESLEIVRCERDDFAEYLKAAREEVNHLDGQLRSANVRYANSMDSLSARNLVLQMELDRWQAEVEHSSIVILASECRNIDVARTRDSLSQFVEAVRPWYEYYTQEAGRGWTAKLFGTHKADVPGTAEPVLVSEEIGAGMEVKR